MVLWWQTLTLLERVLLYLAVPSTLLLLLQTLLLFVGGGGDADGGPDLDGDGVPDGSLDLDGDGIPDTPDDTLTGGLNVFTLRGIVAFFCLFGWGGLWLCQLGLNVVLALFLAVQLGVLGMVGIALVLRAALRLQYDGTLRPQNAVGLSGTVYLTIPAARKAAGKVTVLVQEQLQEFDAVTDSPDPIPTGAAVAVLDLAGQGALLVAPAPSEPPGDND